MYPGELYLKELVIASAAAKGEYEADEFWVQALGRLGLGIVGLRVWARFKV